MVIFLGNSTAELLNTSCTAFAAVFELTKSQLHYLFDIRASIAPTSRCGLKKSVTVLEQGRWHHSTKFTAIEEQHSAPNLSTFPCWRLSRRRSRNYTYVQPTPTGTGKRSSHTVHVHCEAPLVHQCLDQGMPEYCQHGEKYHKFSVSPPQVGTNSFTLVQSIHTLHAIW